MHEYWYFHAENKKLKKEEHYPLRKAEIYWIIYKGTSFRKNKKEGFALFYNNKKLD